MNALLDSIPLLVPMGILAAFVTYARRGTLAKKLAQWKSNRAAAKLQAMRARSNRLTHSRLGRRA